jgi:hypothetical protein
MSAKESALIPIVKNQILDLQNTTIDTQEQYRKIFTLLLSNP